jgi:serine protease
VVTVGATGKAGARAYYSNYGTTVEVSAPGGDSNADAGDTILSTLNAGTRSPGTASYARYQGTSMAAPHVAGIVSLVLSVDPTLTPAEVTALLRATARPFDPTSPCTGVKYCGTGITDAGAAVSAAAGGSPSTTTTTIPVTTTTTVPVTTTTTTTTVPVTTTTTTVPGGRPGAFVKVSPSNGATRLRSVTLTWSSSTGATVYEVCFDRTLDGACNGTWTAISGTSAGTSGLRKSTTYEWQVRAVNGSGTTVADSGTWYRFTTR